MLEACRCCQGICGGTSIDSDIEPWPITQAPECQTRNASSQPFPGGGGFEHATWEKAREALRPSQCRNRWGFARSRRTRASQLPSAMKTETFYYASEDGALPPFVVQLTTMKDSYMIWAGVTDASAAADNGAQAIAQGRLGHDWAVAMPSLAAGTPLLQNAGSDVALAMAHRLARKYEKQIFLSVDLPPGFAGAAGLGLAVERELNAVLKSRK